MNDFDLIYKETADKVYRYLFSICQDAELAEELTEETFYRAYLNLENFRGECSVLTWLCQIGKNIYLKDKKRKNRTVPLDDNLTDDNSFFSNLENKDLAMKIYDILLTFDESKKDVFFLHTFGQLSFKEIGKVYCKSESWAKMTYYRTKEELKERMTENDNK